MKSKSKPNITLEIISLLIIIISTIAFIIFVIYCYSQKKFMFGSYDKIPLPNTFKPLGTVTKLTPDEIEARRQLIESALNTISQ